MTTPENEQHRLEKSDRYAKLSRLKLGEAQQELNQGDTMQASEKAYGAVSCAAKAYGEKRGWNHYNHHRVGLIIEQLREEWQEPFLVTAHSSVKALHDNFFEHELATVAVQDHIGFCSILLGKTLPILESFPNWAKSYGGLGGIGKFSNFAKILPSKMEQNPTSTSPKPWSPVLRKSGNQNRAPCPRNP